MMTRRECLLAVAAVGSVADALAWEQRLERTDAGQGMLLLGSMRPGDPCTVQGRAVRWKGRFLGLLPSHVPEMAACRIARATTDDEGMSDIRVALSTAA